MNTFHLERRIVRSSRIIGLFLLMAFMVYFAMVPLALANEQFTLGSVTGVWINADDSPTFSGSEIRWGGSTGYGQSGYKFIGSGSGTYDYETEFSLGEFWHYNWPIYPPAITWADLEVTLHFTDPPITPDPVFTYRFNHDETPNYHNCTYCTYSPCRSPGCPDKVTFPNAYSENSYRIGDKLYTLLILGFKTSYSGGSTVDEFITQENEDNQAYLTAMLTSVLVPEPQITLVAKETSPDGTTWYDADEAPGPYIPVDDTVYWRYIVQNTGNVTMTNITVTDDRGVSVSCPQTSLDPGESMTCTATGTAVSGQYKNVASATGEHDGTTYDGGCDLSHYFGAAPALAIEKTGDTGPVNYGDTIHYTITVTNTGNVDLHNLTIVDTKLGINQNVGTLSPGDDAQVTGSYGPIGDDDLPGPVVNTASATSDETPDPVQDDHSVEIRVPDCDDYSVEYLGSNYDGNNTTFTYRVSASNDPAISHWVLELPDCIKEADIVSAGPGTWEFGTDPTTGVRGIKFESSVEPGSPVTFTITLYGYWNEGSVDTGIKAGQIICLGTTTGPACVHPCIDLEKSGPTHTCVGEEVTYHFRVENCGDIVLHTGAHVYDPLINPSGDHKIWSGVLQPGQVEEFDRTYTIKTNDPDPLVNEAWAIGHPPGHADVRSDDSWSIDIGGADLGVTKSDSPDPVIAGNQLTYTITVTNNGPCDATGVVVADDLPVGVTYSSHSVTQGTYHNSTGVWDVEALSNGASATLTLHVSVGSSTLGQITNNVCVDGDPDHA